MLSRTHERGAASSDSGVISGVFGVLILVNVAVRDAGLAERRSVYIITLLGSIFGPVALVLHMKGAGLVGGTIANSSGIFFRVWTLIALGVTGSFFAIVAARGLWRLRRRQSRQWNIANSSGRERGEINEPRRQ